MDFIIAISFNPIIMKTKFLFKAALGILMFQGVQAQNNWSLQGNQPDPNQFIGTTGNQALRLRTQNQDRLVIDEQGNFIMPPFAGSAQGGLLRYNAQGRLMPFSFTGSSMEILRGNGQFSHIGNLSGFFRSGNDVFALNPGRIGIGTQTPTEKVDIVGNLRVRGQLLLDNDLTITGNMQTEEFATDTLSATVIRMGANSKLLGKSTIEGDASTTGKMGVGVADPVDKFEVQGGNAHFFDDTRIDGDVELHGDLIKHDYADGFEGWVGVDGDGKFRKRTPGQLFEQIYADVPCEQTTGLPRWSANTQDVYICRQGVRVGIGTNQPQSMLDVSGHARILDLYTPKITANQYYQGTTELASWIKGGANAYFATGNVGIGTSAPAYRLDVNGGANALRVMGTSRFCHATSENENVDLSFDGANAYLKFNGENPEGRLIITTQSQKGVLVGENLTVNGRVGSCKVVVTPGAWSWCDYVFDKNYCLKPLEEVEATIKEEHHLPNVPSAAEIEGSGMDVGALLRMQMEKIEELTLYVIAQHKELESLKKK